jgi:hypothetical protein
LLGLNLSGNPMTAEVIHPSLAPRKARTCALERESSQFSLLVYFVTIVNSLFSVQLCSSSLLG